MKYGDRTEYVKDILIFIFSVREHLPWRDIFMLCEHSERQQPDFQRRLPEDRHTDNLAEDTGTCQILW